MRRLWLGSRRSAGSLFQAEGSDIAKARVPIVKVCDLGTNNTVRLQFADTIPPCKRLLASVSTLRAFVGARRECKFSLYIMPYMPLPFLLNTKSPGYNVQGPSMNRVSVRIWNETLDRTILPSIVMCVVVERAILPSIVMCDLVDRAVLPNVVTCVVIDRAILPGHRHVLLTSTVPSDLASSCAVSRRPYHPT